MVRIANDCTYKRLLHQRHPSTRFEYRLQHYRCGKRGEIQDRDIEVDNQIVDHAEVAEVEIEDDKAVEQDR